MTKYTSRNNSRSHFDDGGANKKGDRRRRRWLRNLVLKIFGPTCVVILLIIVYHFHTRSRTSNDTNKDRSSIIGSSKQNQENENSYRKPKYRWANRSSFIGSSKQNQENDNSIRKPKYRWTNPVMLPPLTLSDQANEDSNNIFNGGLHRPNTKIQRSEEDLIWDNGIDDEKGLPGPKIDYTKIQYKYPDNILIPPRGGSYPPMEPLGDLMKKWPQEDIDSPPQPFMERLQHFDYLDPVQMEAAVKYRDLEFPFKVYNVPEIKAASEKWTDEYLSYHFDRDDRQYGKNEYVDEYGDKPIRPAKGHCQQSVDSFFAFFNEGHWNKTSMGPPPTINNDFTFERFAKHARYADAVGLPANEEHFYWQSGVQRKERLLARRKWGFISRDLPSFSSPDPTFFGFNPPEQHGIQCRLGERGVAAATHYDGGRNMIAMITGAKRYILSPPIECGKVCFVILSIYLMLSPNEKQIVN